LVSFLLTFLPFIVILFSLLIKVFEYLYRIFALLLLIPISLFFVLVHKDTRYASDYILEFVEISFYPLFLTSAVAFAYLFIVIWAFLVKGITYFAISFSIKTELDTLVNSVNAHIGSKSLQHFIAKGGGFFASVLSGYFEAVMFYISSLIIAWLTYKMVNAVPDYLSKFIGKTGDRKFDITEGIHSLRSKIGIG
jgi:hypothetical protein